MNNQLLFVAISLTSQLANAQLTINPIVGVSGSMNTLDQDGIFAKSISFSPGIEINDRSYFSVDFQYTKSANKIDCLFDRTKLKGFMGSVSIMLRILNSDLKLSPVVGLSLGSGVYSNSNIRSRSMAPDYNAIPAEVEEHDFDALRFFAKGKFLLDVRLEIISLRIGPTYSLFEARRFVFEEQKIRSKAISGLGLEMAVVIPLSKRVIRGHYHIPGQH